jgi:hypothetical protein
MKHPGHTYGGFVPAISERGVTVLLSLGWSRASIAAWRCRHSWSWGGRLTSTGAMIIIMTLLSTVEASGVRFIRCGIQSGWDSLSIPIPIVQSLKEIGAWNHLTLRGDKSLYNRLRHQLKTLSDGEEDRSGGRRINVDAGPRVGVLLSLTLLFVLAQQYSSPILEHKSLVYHGLKVLEVSGFQSIIESIIQSIEETLLLLLVGMYIIWCIVGKLCKMSDILAHCHGSLLQILELLLIELDNTLRYVM